MRILILWRRGRIKQLDDKSFHGLRLNDTKEPSRSRHLHSTASAGEVTRWASIAIPYPPDTAMSDCEITCAFRQPQYSLL
jgi:hypothetical protein